MIGKASEIRTIEVEVMDINSWMMENPDRIVIDIKYHIVQSTDFVQGGHYALIIYKEVETHA